MPAQETQAIIDSQHVAVLVIDSLFLTRPHATHFSLPQARTA